MRKVEGSGQAVDLEKDHSAKGKSSWRGA
jgi:hypothetical protein